MNAKSHPQSRMVLQPGMCISASDGTRYETQSDGRWVSLGERKPTGVSGKAWRRQQRQARRDRIC